MARRPKPEDYDNGEVDLSMVDSMQLIDEIRKRFDHAMIILKSQPTQDLSWPRVHFNGDLFTLRGMCNYADDIVSQTMMDSLRPPKNI